MKVFVFLLVLLLVPAVYAADPLQRELDRIANADPVEEQLKIINEFKEQNFLLIDHGYVVGMGSSEVYGLMPSDSLRVDSISGNLLFEFFISNKFPVRESAFPVLLYDVRISVKSLDDSFPLNAAFRIDEGFTGTAFRAVSIDRVKHLPAGTYPVEVVVSGRDVSRQVHSDRQVFYFNVGVPGNSTGIQSIIMEREISNQNLVRNVILFAGIVLLALLIIGVLIYKKLMTDPDDY